MSRLDELIQELCPDGVEYRKLGELGKFFGGLTGKSKDDFTDGNAKFITYKNVYINPSLQIDVEERVKIADGERQRTLQYGDVIFTASSETPDECGMSSVVTVKTEEKLYLNSFCFFFRFDDLNIMLPDFAKHLFRSNELRYQIGKTASGVTRYNVSKKLMEKVSIPLPPLEVQREIVRILDNFTELTAELTARKKQYEFYRDKLLTISNEQVAMCNLGDICESIADGDHMPPPKADTGIPFITISNITDQNKIDFSNTMFVQHAYYDALAEKRKPQKGDILYTVVGSYGIPICIEEDREFVFQRHIAILRPQKQIVKPRYMFHAMQSSTFKVQADKTAKGAAQKTIGLAALATMKLPVPPLDVQNRLVQVLDNFEAICTDLNIGLPAEIEARQKQYEFYRDALLTYAATGKIIPDRQTDRQTDRAERN